MSQHLEILPLFPLNTVLFPYANIQIHVFEERYREMIRQCNSLDQGFGIVLIRSGSEIGGDAEPYMVGTAVRIESIQTYDNGNMDVRIKGVRRFRIRKLDESQSYLVGHVEPLVELEVEESPRADALVMKAREYLEIYLESYFARLDVKAKATLPQDPTALSFAVANFLQIENLEKQHLLETTDTIERLSEMLPILRSHMSEIQAPEFVKLTRDQLAEWITPN